MIPCIDECKKSNKKRGGNNGERVRGHWAGQSFTHSRIGRGCNRKRVISCYTVEISNNISFTDDDESDIQRSREGYTSGGMDDTKSKLLKTFQNVKIICRTKKKQIYDTH